MLKFSPVIRISLRTVSSNPSFRVLSSCPRPFTFQCTTPLQRPQFSPCGTIRSFASAAQYSASSTSFPDPSRPELHYHFFDPPTPLSASLPAFALSFLPHTPKRPDSPTVMGWLPAQIYEADSGREDDLGLERQQDAGLNDFKENPKFKEILHQTIKEALGKKEDIIWVNGALQLQNGWMHIQDQRNIPALGRIGDPDDIIASVLVEDSNILTDTYQPMPAYRLCTADGLTQLTPDLQSKLITTLQRINDLES